MNLEPRLGSTGRVKMARLSVLAFLALAASARAWDTNAHKVIGVIAYRHLTPQAKPWADGLLKDMPNGY